jgi:glycosyltransferase involved in cell wall biosynthesis
MRVFNIMLGRAHGGLEQAAIDYAKMLAANAIDGVTLGHPKGWMRDHLPSEFSFLPLRCITDFDPVATWRLRGYVRKHRPDVIIAHGTRAMRYAAGVSGVKKIGVLHNTRFKPDMAAMDGFIAVSPRVAAAALERFPDKPVQIVPNMVRVGGEVTRSPFRDPLILGSLGRLHTNKGYDVLLKALATPALVAKPWRLVLGGDGPERASLEREAQSLGLADRIHFVGWVSDRHAFFNGLDIFVFPSREEPFGIVLIEAMAEALPVIVTDTDGPSFIVRDEETGLIVQRENSEALAQAIMVALEKPSDMAAKGLAGYQDIKARFSREAVAALLWDALRSFD